MHYRYALAFLLTLGCEDEDLTAGAEPVRPVRAEQVELSSPTSARRFSGKIKAGTETRLSFKVGGTATNVRAKVGDQIKKGQVVATLEAQDQSLQIQAAEASVQRMRAQLENAKAQHARVKALYENGNATQSDLDAARTAVASAQASLKALGKQVELAQAQAGKTVLRSPAAGVVASVGVEAGENVAPGQPVLVLNSGGRPEVEFIVPETVIANVQVGMPASVRIDALGNERFDASVTEVGVTTGKTATTYPVIASLKEQSEKLRPGMAAQVSLQFGDGKDSASIRVSARAVGEDRSGRFVFAAKPESGGFAVVQRKEVVVGGIGSGGLEIKEGLEPGDWLITAGLSHLRDGQKVRLPSSAAAKSTAKAPASENAPASARAAAKAATSGSDPAPAAPAPAAARPSAARAKGAPSKGE